MHPWLYLQQSLYEAAIAHESITQAMMLMMHANYAVRNTIVIGPIIAN